MSGRPGHPLEAWTRLTFGEEFARLVLHGLRGKAKSRTFRVTLEGAGGTGRTTITVTKPLPEAWGLKPLVLAALLKQLVGRQGVGRTLGFTFRTLLAELRWQDIPGNWRLVDDAISSYAGCRYSSVAGNDDGAGRRGHQYCCGLLTQYVISGGDRPRRVQFSGLEQAASFDEDFVEGLRQGRVVFARTDFGELSAGRASSGARRGAGPAPAAETAGPPPSRPFLPPEPRPTLLVGVTPARPGPGDLWSKVWTRATGETTVSFDTGAKVNAILRLLCRVAARHPPGHAPTPESLEAVAEYACREFDRRLQEGLRSLAETVPRDVCRDILYRGRDVIHSLPVEVPQGRPGPRPVWRSADHLVSYLERAVEAIEFDREWKPPPETNLNRGWDPNKVHTATLKMVVAYWVDKEGMERREVDASKMSKWLKSFGLPGFKELRERLRLRIARRVHVRAGFDLFRDNLFLLTEYFLSLPLNTDSQIKISPAVAGGGGHPRPS